PTPSQHGAIRVLEPDALAQLETRRQILEERRNKLYDAMTGAGFRLPSKPQGAFYLYWDVADLTENTERFCQQCLEQTGVVLTPGKDFGQHQADRFVRLAYTTPVEKLLEAVERLKTFVRSDRD
ncbi:MAG: aminotransferase class I/II-fold pyridoxal phosphate-dependent enzyme, partial [Hydrogenovibrio sp.]|nr:aminotransferase class I/II-fold pyridoxal phosphate-dependent enzyme [Hydrogenovibrio sp.]